MSVVQDGDFEELPCGCKIWCTETNTKTFNYEPCSTTCKNYLAFLREVEESGRPLRVYDLRSE